MMHRRPPDHEDGPGGLGPIGDLLDLTVDVHADALERELDILVRQEVGGQQPPQLPHGLQGLARAAVHEDVRNAPVRRGGREQVWV